MFRPALIAALALPLAPAAAQLQGTLQQHAFTGPITQAQVRFNIYLPPAYAASTLRYPVIYHLHGLGGSQGGPHNTTVPASFEAAMMQNVIGPVIVVFPNGYTDSFWADSIGGDKPAETDVVSQLIPYVDANFRTIPTRGARIIEGFSMGGFGATKFYSKFPDLFAACVEYDGALVTWSTMIQSHPSLASGIFGGSEAYFNQFSPWHWTTANAPTLSTGSPIRMVVGLLAPGNRQFRDHLGSLNIPVDYIETTCEHELGCLLTSQGLNSAAFIAAHLDLTWPPGCYANCDGSTAPPFLNVNDFQCFIGRYAASSPAANCDGSTTPPVLNVNDFACFLTAYAAGCP